MNEFSFGEFKCVATPYSEGIVNFRIRPDNKFTDRKSLMTVALPMGCVCTAGEGFLQTKELRVEFDNGIKISDNAGNLLQSLVFEAEKTEIHKNIYDETELKQENTVDGVRVTVDNIKSVFDRWGYKAKINFNFADDEAVYGFGSGEEGLFNLRGRCRHIYQQNLKAINPYMVSTNKYGMLFDCYSAMIFRDNEFGSYLYMDTVSEINFFFVHGESMDELIKGYRFLTGAVPMLPKWAFGYVQSKERYESGQELIDVVKEYRRRKIPIDCIVLDWKSWSGELWGNKILDSERFPDPIGLTDTLHGMNTKLMVSVWPNMASGGENYFEMMDKGYMLGNKSTYNAFDENARKLYWKQANEGLFESGIDAWWCDCTEPFEADWNGKLKPEPEIRYEMNVSTAKKYIDSEYINAFSLLHSKGIYEGQRSTTDKKRVVNLTRSSYGGQQRFSTVVWSGDTYASWSNLRRQIAESLNFVSSGIPYWTMDIGAFFVKKWDKWFGAGSYDNGVEDDEYKELYTRWFQWGAFLPMFRSHGTDTPREVWRFGEEGSVYYDTLVNFIKLRYSLLPYIYSLSAMVTFDDYTMMRPLVFDFGCDEVKNISDQFMFGDIMVCPVTEKWAVSRNVYLPEGNWYDFWTDEKFRGGRYISVNVSIRTIPLFVKEGSIIITGSEIQHSGEEQELTARVYTGKPCAFKLYSDAGDGYGYENGEYTVNNLVWDENTLETGNDNIKVKLIK